MNSVIAIGIYITSGFIAAISQLMLKLAAMRPNCRSGFMRYMDIRIVLAYGMLFTTILFNMFVMRYMPYKYVPVLSSLSYVFVLILGKMVLKETIGKKRIVGIAMIFLGMFIFYLG
jgi:drug/metabolite transporter (DMT)-like permease